MMKSPSELTALAVICASVLISGPTSTGFQSKVKVCSKLHKNQK